jgi:acyl-CoA synthetase (NDP forming)
MNALAPHTTPGDTPPDDGALARAIAPALGRPEGVMLESEGLELLRALGFAVPNAARFADAAAIGTWTPPAWAGERVVLKALSPRILHKTDEGAVAVLPARPDAIAAVAREMRARLAARDVQGFLVCEFVPHETGPGREFLLGLRRTRDFGPVVTFGPGGIHAEFLAAALREDRAFAVFSPALDDADVAEALSRLAVVRLAVEPQRGLPPVLALDGLARAVRGLLALARAGAGARLAEFEVNPLVASRGRLVALDALGRIAGVTPAAPVPRPLARVRQLLEPRSIAVMGVSEKMNPGRIILRNVLREGFDPAAITVIKPGTDAVDGCRCVPSLEALPAPVDLLVLSVSAPQAADALARVADHHLAESVVLIPGGLDENPEAAPLVAGMRESLARARATAWGGPVVNGGNCLGVRSRPGRYDTLFIPESKLPRPPGAPGPLALVTGSGAFAVSKGSKLASLQPVYTITIGNQMDLTVADYFEALESDTRAGVFAVYLEGFRPGDGDRFARVARRLTRAGRPVVLYLAGRTAAGAAAAASHTASVAGDFTVARQICAQAGVVLADSLEDFEDLVRLFVHLRGLGPGGLRLGAVSNAGFEAVAIADHLGPFTLADWSERTRAVLDAVLAGARLDGIVAPRNPMDLTPLLGDEGSESVLRAVLDDAGTDVAVFGCVPLTQALQTLAPGPGHDEDLARAGGIVSRLIRLRRESAKPWVVVVDAGPLYDPMADALEAGGVPVFRTADRALRAFGRWATATRVRA